MPVLLQELLLAFRLVRTGLLRSLEVLPKSLLFWQRPSPLDFLPLDFSPDLFLLVALDTSEFTKPPRFEFALRVKSVRVVNIWDFFLLLL